VSDNPAPSATPEYMTPAEFAAKVDWEGGTIGALDYGLRADALDPGDEASKALRDAWAALQEVYVEQYEPAAQRVDDIFAAMEGTE
jgi:hypothetical protein